jgi:hypothetical protein
LAAAKRGNDASAGLGRPLLLAKRAESVDHAGHDDSDDDDGQCVTGE